MSDERAALADLARAWDVEPGYHDVAGVYRETSTDALLAVLRGLGVAIGDPAAAPELLEWRRDEISRRPLEPVVAAWDDDPVTTVLRAPTRHVNRIIEVGVRVEGGGTLEWRVRLGDLPLAHHVVTARGFTARRIEVPEPLPFGVHQMRVLIGDLAHESRLIVAPRRGAGSGPARLRRAWGAFMPLYALHSARSGAVGDLGDLDDLAGVVEGMGASVVSTLPLLAAFLRDPCEPSPYNPVSRRFWNELYIDLERVPELRWSHEAATRLASRAFRTDMRALRDAPMVDYRRAAALRREVLEILARAVAVGPPQRAGAFRNFLADQPEVAKYARFRAAGERYGTNWRAWPAGMRDGVIGFTDVDPAADEYHRYVQWIAGEQMNELSVSLRRRGQVLALDLPLGCHPDGFDVWVAPDGFGANVSAGAPPDELAWEGQCWGFPPPHPGAMRREGFASFRACLAHHLRQAGLLRIDHVMALHRLWWVPDGLAASEGAYVRYPAEELWATVCLEAHRYGADIVGENLGTVPDEVNEALDRHGARRMHVVEFAIDPDSEQPVCDAPDASVATFTTHDLPTYAGWWEELDLDGAEQRGTSSAAAIAPWRAERAAARAALWRFAEGDGDPPAPAPPRVLDAVHARLADGAAGVVMVNLEDVWQEREPQNVPGTVDDGNWRRKARRTLEEIAGDPATASGLEVLRERRPSSSAARGAALVGGRAVGGEAAGEAVAGAPHGSVLSDLDLYLLGEGRHYSLHDKLGAHLHEAGGVAGTNFAVWAPEALEVSVIGDFNDWGVGRHPLRPVFDSGVWEGFVPGVGRGARYKYAVRARHGGGVNEKADPFAFRAEEPPRTASIVWDLDYPWRDAGWMARRGARQQTDRPLSIYELHLGSWRRVPEEGNRRLTYRELAPLLAEYVEQLGYTHVELMPVMEHPFFGSWGYQITGYFAASSRYGTPQDLMYLIDHLHRRDIGVILDWVPSHFPSDGHGLAEFDGSHLYEHSDPVRRVHPDWDSLLFNYGRNEVRSFLISNALFWLDYFHADGLRTDAVASMLYLDYSREAGEWTPNPYGGHEDLDAIRFLRECNAAIGAHVPDAISFAEESTSWAGVTRPAGSGGLGFWFKWDMGWMHDTLDYFRHDPIHRRYHQDELTFRGLYAESEQFVLPLSHDEVVHGKGALLARMPGDDWQQRANLRLLYGYQHGLPGKKLLFMGDDIGARDEWDHQGSVPWHLLDHAEHAGIAEWVARLNRLHREIGALHEGDCGPGGFEWIDVADRANSVLSWLRFGHRRDDPVIAVVNLTPVPRHGYRIGAPEPGRWRVLANSDAPEFGGSGYPIADEVEATAPGIHGRPYGVELTLPPLGLLFLQRAQHVE